VLKGGALTLGWVGKGTPQVADAKRLASLAHEAGFDRVSLCAPTITGDDDALLRVTPGVEVRSDSMDRWFGLVDDPNQNL
jgi:hypothetical protein